MKIVVKEIVAGLRTGPLVYLLAYLLGMRVPSLTSGNVLIILGLSAAYGSLSLLFELESLPYLLLVFFHFLGTSGLTIFANAIYHRQIMFRWDFWSIFLLLYFIVWLFVLVNMYISKEKVNQVLKKKRLSDESKKGNASFLD